ncbi:MAG: peptidylprolyl isomerase, partial [Rhodospirillaceae bacterium]|nr:peptidylprolyl isomerase [Rhodospirillaceae bacterium]
NTEDAARARTEAVISALKGGADFAELAVRQSECPTAMQGGMVGTVATGTLYPEVEALAFALDTGAWGGPVRSELGWHIVICDAILAPESIPFAEAETRIRSLLTKQARRAAQTEWLRVLMNRPIVVAA